MPVTIRIPTPLRKLTEGADSVEVDGATVGEALSALDARHPGFREKLVDEKGSLRRFINVYLGDEDVRFMDGLQTPLTDGAQLSIVPAIAGGR